MTIVFIENILGSGQLIEVLEDFGDHVVQHRLRPDDNARIAVSRFKSIVVTEAQIAVPVRALQQHRRPAAVARA